MKNRKIIVLSVSFYILITSAFTCGKGTCADPVAHSLLLQMKKSGVDIKDSIKSNIKCFYLNGTERKYIQEFTVIDMPISLNYLHGKVVNVPYIGDKSAYNGIKNFYLEYANGSFDTLYLDNQLVSCEDGLKDICTCVAPIKNFTYNGTPVKRDTSVHWEIIWILDKP